MDSQLHSEFILKEENFDAGNCTPQSSDDSKTPVSDSPEVSIGIRPQPLICKPEIIGCKSEPIETKWQWAPGAWQDATRTSAFQPYKFPQLDYGALYDVSEPFDQIINPIWIPDMPGTANLENDDPKPSSSTSTIVKSAPHSSSIKVQTLEKEKSVIFSLDEQSANEVPAINEDSTILTSKDDEEQINSSMVTIEIPEPGTPGSALAAVLAQDSDGRIIIKSYIHNDSFLSATARRYLVNFIIKLELDKALMTLSPYGGDQLPGFTISTDQLTKFSEEIAGLFPSENPKAYFTPFQVVNGVRKDPTGKLWEHYNYVKGVLRDQGVLVRKTTKRNQQADAQTVDLTENDVQKIKKLETTSGPLDELLDLWKDTFEARREILLKECNSTLDYYNRFIGLRMQEGVHLINYDFKRLYPDKCTALNSKWDLLKGHLISLVGTSKAIKNAEDKALAIVLPKLTKDQQVSVIFYLLAAIAPADRTGKKRKASASDSSAQQFRKTSLEERRESFSLRVPPPTLLTNLQRGNTKTQIPLLYTSSDITFHTLAGQGELTPENINAETIDDPDEQGLTGLMWASAYGQLGSARQLLNAGANKNYHGHNGETALHLAAAYGHHDLVKLLLTNGADYNVADEEGNTPLIYGAIGDHPHVCHELLTRGADVTHRNVHNISAYQAATLKKASTAKVVIENFLIQQIVT